MLVDFNNFGINYRGASKKPLNKYVQQIKYKAGNNEYETISLKPYFICVKDAFGNIKRLSDRLYDITKEGNMFIERTINPVNLSLYKVVTEKNPITGKEVLKELSEKLSNGNVLVLRQGKNGEIVTKKLNRQIKL